MARRPVIMALVVLLLLAVNVAARPDVDIVEGAQWSGDTLECWTGQNFYLDGFNESYPTRDYHYEWYFGDGDVREGPVASHAYTEPGEYDITLNIYNETGPVNSVLIHVVVKKSITLGQLIFVTSSIIGIPILLLMLLNLAVITTGRIWRFFRRPGEPYVKWTWRSITMFNLMLLTAPIAFVLSPVYILPAIVGCVFWIILGFAFVHVAPLLLGIFDYEPVAELMGERFSVISRDVVYYSPVKGSLWKAIKQRSGVALEMMPVPLFGVFVLIAMLFKYTGDINATLTSPYLYIILGAAPIYTSFMAIIRILKDSNIAFISAKQVRVQFLGDMLEKAFQKVGLLGSVVAVFQIVVVFSPNLESAWSTLLVLVPVVVGLVLAYMFLTVFVYLGFHPRLVRHLNKALEKSNLPKYTVKKEDGLLAILPPRRRGGNGPPD